MASAAARQPSRRKTANTKSKNVKTPLTGRLSKYWAVGGFDVPFLLLVILILTTGLIMLFSASYTYAYYNEDGDSAYFFKRQLIYALIGLIAMFGFSKIKYDYFRAFAILLIPVSFLLLLIVLKFHTNVGDFKRWIGIGPLTFQPSEIAKLALILYCAYGFEKDHRYVIGKSRGKTEGSRLIAKYTHGKIVPYDSFMKMCWYGGIILAMAVLVFMENHLSGTLLLLAIGVAMMFLGGVHIRWFVAGSAAVLALALIVCVPIARDVKTVQKARAEKIEAEAAGKEYDMSQYDNIARNGSGILQGYQRERIYSWLDKEYSPKDARWQTNNAIYAIGSGGIFGVGLGNSKQKHLYVSEPQNDFIFSIVCEEVGVVGASFIIILFALLVWRGVVIGIHAKDRFGALLAMGIVFHIGMQTILNILVVSDALPNTGISLPFFSYGGTSLVMLLSEMGMVLSVSRYSRLTKK